IDIIPLVGLMPDGAHGDAVGAPDLETLHEKHAVLPRAGAGGIARAAVDDPHIRESDGLAARIGDLACDRPGRYALCPDRGGHERREHHRRGDGARRADDPRHGWISPLRRCAGERLPVDAAETESRWEARQGRGASLRNARVISPLPTFWPCATATR